ncbi:FimV/HubP family polar landmark protein [Microbulbifer hainanensis]|uniref:FimV/HubP family polar landmark protein n=1 Tax=Microbulbifer hainanensis TaxID=2735675 RepID=UPI001865C1B6|nr:FimV/HubP family polar landmark protein [Microbulbifer hainanensis]
MRVRKLALAVGLVSALGGNGALALGLGEIKVNSTLNQPLNAEIGLLQTRGLGDGEIKVRLASPEDFKRAGVDRTYLASELRFEVDYSNGQPIIRITTRDPIREPYLDFLVETRWPSGRLLREYTLLMDLPAFSNSTAQQPVRAAERERQQVRREAPQPQQRPVQQPTRPVQPAPTAEPQQAEQPAAEEPMELQREAQPSREAVAESGSQVYGPVSSNETLWEIALQNRASREFSVQQTMLAIQRLNPEAFINENINLLKKGAVLRLPSTADMRQLSQQEAISEVAVQNESWRQRTGQSATTGAPLDARAASEESTESDVVEGRVSLAAPGDNESVTSGSGSGAEDSEALSGELAVTEEELDKSSRENAELKDRISELDEQIDTMEQMVEVSNSELEAVQTAAEQSNNADEAAAETDSSTGAEDTTSPAAAESAEEEPDSTAAPAKEEPAADDQRNRVVPVHTQPEPTLMERVMDNIVFIGIGAGALLIGLFGFMSWRRRKEEEEAIRQVEAEMAAERALADAPEESAESDDHLAAVESFEASDSFDMGDLDEVGTDDPISEAEIHLSLSQYGEAESKLLKGLAQDPQNVDARLMLLEVYAHEQNVDKFDDHYRQLLTVSDGPAADRAARLRESIAGAGAFEAPEVDFTSESIEATQLDDISASFEDDFASDDFTSSTSSEEADSSLLDDLTMDLSDDSISTSDTSGEEEFSMDLDLDLEGDSAGESSQELEAADDEFNFDDLMSGDLDLGELDLDAGSTESGDAAATDSSEDFGSIDFDSGSLQLDEDEAGLDFDLDLSPMEEGDDSETFQLESDDSAAPAASTAAEPADSLDSDDLESFGGELDGELDLDSIDLDDIAGELNPEEAAPAQSASDVAMAQDIPAAQPAAESQAAASDSTDADFGDLNFNLESDLDSELNLLEGSDEVSTKLELAQAYLDMGDRDGAKDILNEVVEEGTGENKARAQEMLERMT